MITNLYMVWVFVSVAVICDLKDFRIPNELIILGYVNGLFLSIRTYHQTGLLMFLVNGLWPIVVLYIFFLFGALGAGDIKLYSVIATMVGADYTIRIILISLIIGAIYGIVSLVKNRKVILEMVAANCILRRTEKSFCNKKYIPSRIHFSLCIAMAMLLYIFGGEF